MEQRNLEEAYLMAKTLGPAQRRRKNEKKLAKRTDKIVLRVVETLKRDPYINSLGVRFLESEERFLVSGMKGVKAFWASVGGYIESSRVHQEVLEVPQDILGAHVSEFERKFDDKRSWRALETLIVQRLVEETKMRVQRILEAGQQNPDDFDVNGLRVGIWTEDVWAASYFEQDSPYFHVLINFPVGAVWIGTDHGLVYECDYFKPYD